MMLGMMPASYAMQGYGQQPTYTMQNPMQMGWLDLAKANAQSQMGNINQIMNNHGGYFDFAQDNARQQMNGLQMGSRLPEGMVAHGKGDGFFGKMSFGKRSRQGRAWFQQQQGLLS
jgi:hypothetical protein